MIVVCSGAMLIIMMAELALMSVGQKSSGQHDMVVLPSWLIPREAMRGSDGLTTMPQQQPQSQMSSDAYANYTMGLQQVIFSSRIQPLIDSICHMLLSIMGFTFTFQFPMWVPHSPIGAQPLGFATLQPFSDTLGRYMCLSVMVHSPCQEYIVVAASPNALNKGSFMLLIQLCPSHSIHMMGIWGLGRVTQFFCFPT